MVLWLLKSLFNPVILLEPCMKSMPLMSLLSYVLIMLRKNTLKMMIKGKLQNCDNFDTPLL